MERRIWVQAGSLTTFANLFTMLVGPAGTGKGIVNFVLETWLNTINGSGDPVFYVGRKSYTKASLVDDLAAARKSEDRSPPFIYHSLLVASEEFSVLFPKFDLELLSFMSEIWNAGRVYNERRRASIVKEVTIQNPIMTCLMGYQPAVMELTLPPSAWEQGFMRRTIMVWNGQPEVKSLFLQAALDQGAEARMCQRLIEISLLYGRMQWEPAAAERIDTWHMEGEQPKPTHTRLVSYNNSRTHFLIKLSMVASISESSEMVIRLRHVDRALAWLLGAEEVMPEIFRAMKGNSDAALMEELYRKMIELYARNNRKMINEDILWAFLTARTPTQRVGQLITAMEKAGLIENVNPPSVWWRPKPGASLVQ
jgi:hypothetical protein